MDWLNFLCYLFVIGVFVFAIGVKAFHKIDLAEQLSEFFDNSISCKCGYLNKASAKHHRLNTEIADLRRERDKLEKEMDRIAQAIANEPQKLYVRVWTDRGFNYIEREYSSETKSGKTE